MLGSVDVARPIGSKKSSGSFASDQRAAGKCGPLHVEVLAEGACPGPARLPCQLLAPLANFPECQIQR